ncbi:hypothetical protein WDZ92_53115, partial [Nostoc sp. NIES-2111]
MKNQVGQPTKFGNAMAKATDTRAKLITGAMEVLCKDGVNGTTTRKIADASGQRLATMHYH